MNRCISLKDFQIESEDAFSMNIYVFNDELEIKHDIYISTIEQPIKEFTYYKKRYLGDRLIFALTSPHIIKGTPIYVSYIPEYIT